MLRSSPRTSPRTRSATQARARRSRSRSRATATTRRSQSRYATTGSASTEADLPRLFERFYRADRARASRGTGLGLAIVKHIVTQAGGTVEARGGAGRGLEIRCVSRRRSRSPVVTTSSPSGIHGLRLAARGDWRHERRVAPLRRARCPAATCGSSPPAAAAATRRQRSDHRGRLEHGRAVHDQGRRGLQGEPAARDVTVGISGTGGGFERFCAGETDISNASRPIEDDEEAALRGERRRVRRAPGRERRAHGRRQPGERLGRLPHDRAAEEDLGARLEGEQLEPGRPVVPGRAAQALRAGHRLRHVRLLHRRDQRRGGREPLRLLGDRGRQRDRPGRRRATRARSATSASRTTRRTRTS